MPFFHAYGALSLAATQVGHNPVTLIPDPRDLDQLCLSGAAPLMMETKVRFERS